MRSEDEIMKALELLDADPGRVDWHGDTFKFGYVIGKLVALGWVLCEAPSDDIGSHFDYEDWRREEQEAGEEIKRWLRGPEPD